MERNPVRAKSLRVRKAERWPWASAGSPPNDVQKPAIDAWPVPRPRNWLAWVNEPQSEAELAALRQCIARGAPYGEARWAKRTAKRLGLEASLRPRGRPRKGLKK